MAEKQQYTQLQFGFDIRTGSLVDRRTVLSYEEMIKGEVVWNGMTIPLKNILPDRYIVLCRGADTPTYAAVNRRFKGKLFVYDSELTHEGDNYRVPLGNSDKGLFTLVTNPIDVVDVDGNSLVDQQTGLVTIYDPDGTRIEDAEQRLETAETNITDLQDTKVNSDDVENIVDTKLKEYQELMPILGDGDVLNSAGEPVDAYDSEGKPVYGVHVNYEQVTGKPWKMQARVTHNSVVPRGGWLSRYAVGGIAAGQGFAAGTKIEDVLRQLLMGDPMADNVIYHTVSSFLPTYWTDVPWISDTDGITRKELLPGGSNYPYKNWNPVRANGEYALISVPLTMCHDYGADLLTEKPIRLDEVYVHDYGSTQFPLAFWWYDVKNDANAAEATYRIYYIDKFSDQYNDLEWTFKFNDSSLPDYDDPDRWRFKV